MTDVLSVLGSMFRFSLQQPRTETAELRKGAHSLQTKSWGYLQSSLSFNTQKLWFYQRHYTGQMFTKRSKWDAFFQWDSMTPWQILVCTTIRSQRSAEISTLPMRKGNKGGKVTLRQAHALLEGQHTSTTVIQSQEPNIPETTCKIHTDCQQPHRPNSRPSALLFCFCACVLCYVCLKVIKTTNKTHCLWKATDPKSSGKEKSGKNITNQSHVL